MEVASDACDSESILVPGRIETRIFNPAPELPRVAKDYSILKTSSSSANCGNKNGKIIT